MEIYTWADNQINSAPKYNTGFTQLMGKNPYFVNNDEWNGAVSRLTVIKEFMRLSLEIFKDVLFNNTDPILKHWLLNETPSHIAWEYHRSLHDRHFSLPVFFRTDESSLGKIMEINCPGSLWGELQLAYEYALLCGLEKENKSPAKLFASQLSGFLGKQPLVHHLLDGATVQPGMRYFIEKTRPEIQYANIDKGVRSADCNFIRNHFFWGLCNELFFLSRLPQIGIDVFYDLPPHVLFSQKAALVLPFWSKTRKFFSDEIRNTINYSVPLLPEGLELESGFVSIKEFCSLSRKKRGYYLKYAGSNVSMNWGSREVNRLSILSSDKCRALLDKCLEKFNSGEIWLLQKEDTHDDIISYVDRNSNEFQKEFRLKLSSFYGPDNCIGMLAMHRNFYKVHGQNDTVISYVMPQPNGKCGVTTPRFHTALR